MLNIINLNNNFQISTGIIFYNLLILILLFTKILPLNIASNLLSYLLLIDFFIIIIMYVTNCECEIKTKIIITFVKLILLLLVLKYAKVNLKNYLISIIICIIYLLISDINKIYSCNIKDSQIFITLIISTFLYILIGLYKHTSSKSKY